MLTPITDNLNYDPTRTALYKRKTMLAVSGMGTILFAAWAIIRTIMTLMAYDGQIRQENSQIENLELYLCLAYGVVIFLLFLELAIRIYVGRAAVAEAKGEKKKGAYLAVAYLLLGVCLFNVLSSLAMLKFDNTLVTTIATLLVEATSSVTMMVLIATARKIHRMNKMPLKNQKTVR